MEKDPTVRAPKAASLIARHPLITFFSLAYALSWGSYLLSARWPVVPFLFPFGPFVAALVTALLSNGQPGLKDILRRCALWRVAPRWYAAALLVPVGIALTAIALDFLWSASPSSAGAFRPWYAAVLLFPAALIDAPLWEEAGWRGYAMPLFPAPWTPLASTLIMALLIATWHLPIALGDSGRAMPYLVASFSSAVLTNWIFFGARESALLAILYHAAANAIAAFYLFPMVEGPDLTRFWWIYAGVHCIGAGLVVFLFGSDLGRSRASRKSR